MGKGTYFEKGRLLGEGCWDDLKFPAQGINVPGGANDPTRDATTGLLSFSGTQDNIIAGVAQMPHAWFAGSILRPHVHLNFPTSNPTKNTRWKWEYNRANNNEAFESAIGSYTAMDINTIANPGAITTLLLPDGFGDLGMVGYRESCCILWRLSRLAGTDPADDDTNACTLVEFDIHYQINKPGTKYELTD